MMPAHMIWLVALVAWPRTCRTEVLDGLAHGRENRLRAFERRAISAGHDGERAFLCALDPAAHRRVDELHRARGKQLLGPARGICTDGGAVDDERVLPQGRCQAFNN